MVSHEYTEQWNGNYQGEIFRFVFFSERAVMYIEVYSVFHYVTLSL